MNQPIATRFVINPALVPTLWQGETFGLHSFKNRNYLNSLWLGIVWNALCIPQRAYLEIVRPALLGMISNALTGILVFIALTLGYAIAGVLGQLIMLPYQLDVLLNSKILDEDDSQLEIAAGVTEAKRAF